jgi:hypothetical protein
MRAGLAGPGLAGPGADPAEPESAPGHEQEAGGLAVAQEAAPAATWAAAGFSIGTPTRLPYSVQLPS